MKRREMLLSVRDLFESDRNIQTSGLYVDKIFYDSNNWQISGALIDAKMSLSIDSLQEKLRESFEISDIEEAFLDFERYACEGEIYCTLYLSNGDELLISSSVEPFIVNIFHDFLNYLHMASPRELLEKMGHYRIEPDLDTDGE